MTFLQVPSHSDNGISDHHTATNSRAAQNQSRAAMWYLLSLFANSGRSVAVATLIAIAAYGVTTSCRISIRCRKSPSRSASLSDDNDIRENGFDNMLPNAPCEHEYKNANENSRLTTRKCKHMSGTSLFIGCSASTLDIEILH